MNLVWIYVKYNFHQLFLVYSEFYDSTVITNIVGVNSESNNTFYTFFFLLIIFIEILNIHLTIFCFFVVGWAFGCKSCCKSAKDLSNEEESRLNFTVGGCNEEFEKWAGVIHINVQNQQV